MKTDEFTEFPPFMPTWLAARYCGFHSTQGLHAAFHKGKILPWGRRAAARVHTFGGEMISTHSSAEKQGWVVRWKYEMTAKALRPGSGR